MHKKLISAIVLLLFVLNPIIHAESLADKREKTRQKPKNNTLSRILGVTSGAAATGIAVKKKGEKKKMKKMKKRKLTAEEKATILKYVERRRKKDFTYGFSTNAKDGNDKIDVAHLDIRFRLPFEFAFRYKNQTETYADDSTRAINHYLFEYKLMPLLIGTRIAQIGAFVGGKTTTTSETTTDLTWGVTYDYNNMNSFYSIHSEYHASVVDLETFVLDSLWLNYVRFYAYRFHLDLGANLNLTDLEDIEYQYIARAGFRL